MVLAMLLSLFCYTVLLLVMRHSVVYFGELSTFVRTVLSGTELCHLAFEGQCSHYFYSVFV